MALALGWNRHAPDPLPYEAHSARIVGIEGVRLARKGGGAELAGCYTQGQEVTLAGTGGQYRASHMRHYVGDTPTGRAGLRRGSPSECTDDREVRR